MYEFDRIETPENVELELPLAGIGSRVVAGFIDALIIIAILIVLAILAYAFGSLDFPSSKSILIALGCVVLFFVQWCYFFLFEWALNGQTPGKRYAKIRVLKETGAAASVLDLVIRNLLRSVDSIGGYFVGLLTMFISPRCQRLGDLAAATLVVSESFVDDRADSIPKSSITSEDLGPENLRTTILDPSEFAALRSYVTRRDLLSSEVREHLLRTLLLPVTRKHAIHLPASQQSMDALVDDLLSPKSTP